jgi:uncharacterized protein (TIGR03437 family)
MKIALIAALVLISASAPAFAQTSPAFANPSFEAPGVGACPSTQADPSGASWTFTGSAGITTAGCGQRFNVPVLPANGGTQAAYIQNAAGFTQSVSGFASGHTYTISFYAAGRPRGAGCDDNCTELNFSVFVGSQDVLDVVSPPTASFKQYTTASFTAIGSAAISFTGIAVSGIDGSSFIDLVSIQDTPPAFLPPTINAGGVVPVFSSANTIAPGSWISIYGTNMASGTTIWNGNFPTMLGGTSVTINNKPAYIWYVSPTQVNVQAPDDTAAGTVIVVVTTAAGSASSSVTLEQYGPSFSLFNGKYPAAIAPGTGNGNSGAGYDYIGPAGAFSFPSRPVNPGETVILFGVGFGPTTPAVPAGVVFSGAAPCVATPQITIGGVTAQVTFAGIIEAGLFQFNVVVPNVSGGDQLLVATVGGVSTPAGVYLTVQ